VTEPQSTPEVNPLVELFHKILNLLPWHAEADVIAAREVVNEELPKLFTQPAGVIKPAEPAAPETPTGADSFPTTPAV
jgi:hypothetical protein